MVFPIRPWFRFSKLRCLFVLGLLFCTLWVVNTRLQPLEAVSHVAPLQTPHFQSHRLQQIALETVQRYFKAERQAGPVLRWADSLPRTAAYRQPAAGLFVTLSQPAAGKPPKTRACWGSLTPPSGDWVKATSQTVLAALTKEYRYPPIQPSEIASLRAQVTVIRQIQPVQSIRQLNPLQDGLMLRTATKSAVILPGEALTPQYQETMARLKAGIAVNESYQRYRMYAYVNP